MKSFLQNNNLEMYLSHNEEKSVIAQQFIRTLKNKIYKRIISISTNMYVGKLDDIVNKRNNTYQSTVKMKPVDVKLNSYIKSSKEINDKDPKFKIGNTVRISKYRKKIVKGYFQIDLKKNLWLKKLKTLCCWHMLLVIVTEKKMLESFT